MNIQSTAPVLAVITMPIYTLWPAAYLAWQGAGNWPAIIAIGSSVFAGACYLGLIALVLHVVINQWDEPDTDTPDTATDTALRIALCIWPLYTFAPAFFASIYIDRATSILFFLCALVLAIAHCLLISTCTWADRARRL